MNVITQGIGRLLYWQPSRPRRAQIEVTNLCNLDCAMCPRKDLGVDFKAMDLKTFKRLVDRLEGIEELDLTGWGESFTHKEVFSMIRYATDKGIKVSVTSNALLLNNENRKRLIDSGLWRISFSIDSVATDQPWGHLNQKGLDNIKALIDESGIDVRVITTLHPEGKKDVLDVVRFAGGLGIKEVLLSRLDLRFNDKLKRASEDEEREIFKAAEKEGRRNGVTVNFVPYAFGFGASRTLYKLTRRFLHQGGRYCLKTYDYIYFNVNAEATPCCALPTYNVGDPFGEDIGSLWMNDAFRTFRRKQRKICSVCDTAMVKNLVPSGRKD